MPRIIPLQLLKCLKVLLDENGGILSQGEVKRIAGLMTKYSKKLVSKCIYVQILKCTKTELLGEFMGSGGWSLTHTWLNDAIRARNWPLVQEILELLLLCPVDVERLKSNSAPKLVKGLCKDADDEGVRILASKLVEQWLKVVTGDVTTQMVPKPSEITLSTSPTAIAPSLNKLDSTAKQTIKRQSSSLEEDPLGATEPPIVGSFQPTPAQKKASESGLVLKCVVKDGKQFWARVENSSKNSGKSPESISEKSIQQKSITIDEDDDEGSIEQEIEEISIKAANENAHTTVDVSTIARQGSSEITDNKENEVSSKKREASVEKEKLKEKEKDASKSGGSSSDKKSSSSSSHKSSSSSGYKSSSSSSKSNSGSSMSKSKSSHKSSSSSKNRDKERERDKDKERSSNKERSSDKDKHRSSSSKSSSSSSNSSSISSGSNKDKDRHNKSTSSSTSSSKKDKEKEKVDPTTQAEKDKDTLSKLSTPSIEKLGKIPRKSKDDSQEAKPTSITIPSKKASMSIEIRRDSEKTKTVKTYKSQFRSHGLTEEAPPPPSRKGLKKPNSASVPGTAIPSTLLLKRSSPPPNTNSSSLMKDAPVEKKAKIEMAALAAPVVEKIGAIKLIPPKKISQLVETNLFSDALSAAMVPKKDARKRKRNSKEGTAKDGQTSPPISPEGTKVAPLKFYQDTLDENKDTNGKTDGGDSKEEKSEEETGTNTEDDDDIPLKKVKEDIEQRVRNEKSKSDDYVNKKDQPISTDSQEAEETECDKTSESAEDIPEEPKKPGPGCGPNGPPGVLLLHRRRGPKKKLTWKPQEQLEQVRFFELDENERVNVTKTFIDMKNMERFSERDAMSMVRRGLNSEDNMVPQTDWVPLVMVDDVPNHPDGNQSRERKIQTEREQTTLRALYFSHAMIPDSPAEPDIEPNHHTDFTVIPLDDITGNPDAVNDFTSMPWPDPKGNAPQSSGNAFNNSPDVYPNRNQFNPFMPFASQQTSGWQIGVPNCPPQGQINMQGPPSIMDGPEGMPPNSGFNNNNLGLGSPNMIPGYGMSPRSPSEDISMMASGINMGPFNGLPRMENNSPQFGPRPNFGPGPGNFGPNMMMDMNGPLEMMGGGSMNGPGSMNRQGSMNGPGLINNQRPMNGLGPMNNQGPMNGPGSLNGPRPMHFNEGMNGPGTDHRRNNNRGGWRAGGGKNFNSDGNWRPAGSGDSNSDRGGNNFGRNNDWTSGGGGNGRVCKQFMRGHCRLGNKCNFIHPRKKNF